MKLNRVAFFLSDGKILEITSYEEYGDWKILSEESEDEIPQSYAEEVALDYVHASEAYRYCWHPYELLKSRVGTLGVAILPSKTMVFFAVRGFDELLFSHMIDSEGNLRIRFNNSWSRLHKLDSQPFRNASKGERSPIHQKAKKVLETWLRYNSPSSRS